MELLIKLSDGVPADGMEALIPALTDTPMVPLASFLPENSHLLLVAPEKIRTRITDLEATDTEFMEAGWEAAAMGAAGPVAAEGLDLTASSYLSF